MEPHNLFHEFFDEVYPDNRRTQRAAKSIQSTFRGFRDRNYRIHSSPFNGVIRHEIPIRGVANLQREARRRGYGGRYDYGPGGPRENQRYSRLPLYKRMERDYLRNTGYWMHRYSGVEPNMPYWERDRLGYN